MINFTTDVRENYTLISFSFEGNLSPDDLAGMQPPAVDGRLGVVLSGRGPIWLYGALVHEYHPTAWVACFDPRLGGAVVVQSHCPTVAVGQVIV